MLRPRNINVSPPLYSSLMYIVYIVETKLEFILCVVILTCAITASLTCNH